MIVSRYRSSRATNCDNRCALSGLRASRPRLRQQRNGGIFFMAQPPLLREGGDSLFPKLPLLRKHATLCTIAFFLFFGVLNASAQSVTWHVDNLSTIGGNPVTVVGSPRVVETDTGKAVEFNGSTDGLFLDINPLAGLERFTVEIEFEPAADGPEEQRFLHFEEAKTENRAVVELRTLTAGSWTLDTYLRYGAAALTLLDRGVSHRSSNWHVAALTFDGKTMSHYVDGVRELGGEVAFKPLSEGRTSIGVRQNRVSWFKGRIRLIRITPAVLLPG